MLRNTNGDVQLQSLQHCICGGICGAASGAEPGSAGVIYQQRLDRAHLLTAANCRMRISRLITASAATFCALAGAVTDDDHRQLLRAQSPPSSSSFAFSTLATDVGDPDGAHGSPVSAMDDEAETWRRRLLTMQEVNIADAGSQTATAAVASGVWSTGATIDVGAVITFYSMPTCNGENTPPRAAAEGGSSSSSSSAAASQAGRSSSPASPSSATDVNAPSPSSAERMAPFFSSSWVMVMALESQHMVVSPQPAADTAMDQVSPATTAVPATSTAVPPQSSALETEAYSEVSNGAAGYYCFSDGSGYSIRFTCDAEGSGGMLHYCDSTCSQPGCSGSADNNSSSSSMALATPFVNGQCMPLPPDVSAPPTLIVPVSPGQQQSSYPEEEPSMSTSPAEAISAGDAAGNAGADAHPVRRRLGRVHQQQQNEQRQRFFNQRNAGSAWGNGHGNAAAGHTQMKQYRWSEWEAFERQYYHSDSGGHSSVQHRPDDSFHSGSSNYHWPATSSSSSLLPPHSSFSSTLDVQAGATEPMASSLAGLSQEQWLQVERDYLSWYAARQQEQLQLQQQQSTLHPNSAPPVQDEWQLNEADHEHSDADWKPQHEAPSTSVPASPGQPGALAESVPNYPGVDGGHPSVVATEPGSSGAILTDTNAVAESNRSSFSSSSQSTVWHGSGGPGIDVGPYLSQLLDEHGGSGKAVTTTPQLQQPLTMSYPIGAPAPDRSPLQPAATETTTTAPTSQRPPQSPGTISISNSGPARVVWPAPVPGINVAPYMQDHGPTTGTAGGKGITGYPAPPTASSPAPPKSSFVPRSFSIRCPLPVPPSTTMVVPPVNAGTGAKPYSSNSGSSSDGSIELGTVPVPMTPAGPGIGGGSDVGIGIVVGIAVGVPGSSGSGGAAAPGLTPYYHHTLHPEETAGASPQPADASAAPSTASTADYEHPQSTATGDNRDGMVVDVTMRPTWTVPPAAARWDGGDYAADHGDAYADAAVGTTIHGDSGAAGGAGSGSSSSSNNLAASGAAATSHGWVAGILLFVALPLQARA